jgi:hypothetical protein
VTAAIFGLVGVIVGSLITVGAEWWRERTRTQRAQRTAARRLRAALGRAGEAIDVALAQSDATPLLGVRGLATVWEAAMGDLVDLTHDDWRAVDRCSFLFAALEEPIGPGGRTALNAESIEILEDLRDAASRGVRTLDKLAR